MKILAIGNSFSDDATAYLHQIASSANVDLTAVNLCIGGCSLETHAHNLKNNIAEYTYMLNGSNTGRKVTIKDTLCEAEWDFVTVQQVSHYSGMYETYEPFGSELLEAVKQYAPKAKIYFHQTWAYDPKSTHPGFAGYDNSMDKMHAALLEASARFSKEHELEIIPCGPVIDNLRKMPVFDCENGKINLCRDGYHMNFIYGRYATAAVWFETFTKKSIFEATFFPVKQDETGENLNGSSYDEDAVNLIKTCVHEACN